MTSRYRLLNELLEDGHNMFDADECTQRREIFSVAMPVCPSLQQYINPVHFGFANDLYQLSEQRHGVLFALTLVLLNRHKTADAERPEADTTDTMIKQCEVLGLWANRAIVMAHGREQKTYRPSDDGLDIPPEPPANLYEFAKKYFQDIGPAVLAAMTEDRYLGYTPNPKSFRALINEMGQPRDDYTWLTIEHVEWLFNRARRRPMSFRKKLRSWLLRQELNTVTRRHLGGRPGRLLENKQGLDADRRHRRVKVRRDQD